MMCRICASFCIESKGVPSGRVVTSLLIPSESLGFGIVLSGSFCIELELIPSVVRLIVHNKDSMAGMYLYFRAFVCIYAHVC